MFPMSGSFTGKIPWHSLAKRLVLLAAWWAFVVVRPMERSFAGRAPSEILFVFEPLGTFPAPRAAFFAWRHALLNCMAIAQSQVLLSICSFFPFSSFATAPS